MNKYETDSLLAKREDDCAVLIIKYGDSVVISPNEMEELANWLMFAAIVARAKGGASAS